MNLRNLGCYALGCLLVVMLARCCIADEAVKDQVKCWTTWDDLYFYLGFRVDCPDVEGTHTKPNADVSGDDAVTVYIDTSSKSVSRISATCFSMSVSAAGGAQFRAGSDSAGLEPVDVYNYKFGATTTGTLNDDNDIDLGYSVEMAIPWDVMKISRPQPGYYGRL